MMESALSTPDETVQQLESTVKLVTQSLNDRSLHNLDPDDPFFELFDETFSAVPGPPSPQTSLSLPQYIELMRELTSTQPELCIHILDLDTNVAVQNGLAQVFVNYELWGSPPGLKRRAIGIFRFRMDPAGNWKVTTLQVADGMEAN